MAKQRRRMNNKKTLSKRKRSTSMDDNEEMKKSQTLVIDSEQKVNESKVTSQEEKKVELLSVSTEDKNDVDEDDDDNDDNEENNIEKENDNDQDNEEDDDEEEDKEEDEEDEEDDEEEENKSSNESTAIQSMNKEANSSSSVVENVTKVSPARFVSDGRYRNKQRCLIVSSRGVTARYRHLLEDLRTLIPHHKKESKLDAGKQQHSNDDHASGGVARAVNDIAEIRGCNTVLFLECRKRGRDAYLWLGRTQGTGAGTTTHDDNTTTTNSSSSVPLALSGPSAKFLLSNVHTMDELRLTGNCMKGSRPILSFDTSFESMDYLRLLKVLFIDIFGTPRGHPKSKPFVDRVMAFYYADSKIWVRNYQILHDKPSSKETTQQQHPTTNNTDETSLVEIGPRFVLHPIRIFRGSFGGQTLYKNEDFISPNETRALTLSRKGHAYQDRKEAQKRRKERVVILPEDPLDSVFR